MLERVGEVVYRVQLAPKGRRVVLHRDRLAPYRGIASPMSTGTRGTDYTPMLQYILPSLPIVSPTTLFLYIDVLNRL